METKTRVVAIAGAVVFAGVVAAAAVVGNTERTVDTLAAEDLIGTWISTTAEGPGNLVLQPGAQAELRDLTIFDQSNFYSVAVLGESINSSGQWVLAGDHLAVDFTLDGEESRWTLLVMSSPIGGVSLQAIVGDPDAPGVRQTFQRSTGDG
ncbi:hypothetical protein ACFM35_00030 [Microbacterium sp. P01]|uniref:hypothetical protein n=1 Tax=Microbacterium sp. P01 TaxID=3366261 RepID=UPI00366E4595